MTRDLAVPFVSAVALAGLIGALALLQAALPKPEDEMASVEHLLARHGFPVDGFAKTPRVNLDAIDAMAPPECAAILRKEYLAKLAVIRMAPAYASDAAGIARAVRFTLATEAGAPGCAR